MTKEQAKKWLPEIHHWANGGSLWGYTKEEKEWFKYHDSELSFERDIYIIEDKHFEARKAFALGEPIEIKCGVTIDWQKCTIPSWNTECKYRPKYKHWYENIPKEGILCWVWDRDDYSKSNAEPIILFEKNSEYPFISNNTVGWVNAEPVKPEECWKETLC